MKTKRMMVFLVAMTLALSTLFGCAQPLTQETETATMQNDDEKVTIEIWNCDGSPLFQEPLEAAAAAFMELHPDITVNIVGLPYDQQQQKFDVAVSTKSTPDAAYQEYFNILSYVNQGALISYDKYFDNWDKKNEFDPKRIDLEMYVINGERYYFPIEFAGPVIFYNKNILDEYGLEPAKTWDEWFEIIEKTTDPSIGRYGSSYAGTRGTSFFEAFLLAYTGVDTYFDSNGACFMRSPDALEGATRFFDAFKNGQVAPSSVSGDLISIANDVAGGVATTIFTNCATYSILAEKLGDSGVVTTLPLPAKNGKINLNVSSLLGGAGYVMYSTSKHPDETWAFISFMLEAQQNSTWCKATGVLPINKNAMEDQWVQESPYLKVVADAFSGNAGDVKVVASPMYLPKYNEIMRNIMEPGFQEVMLGKKSVADYLNECAQALEDEEKAFRG